MPTYLNYPAIEIVPAGPLRGSLAVPSSKSYTNRALLLAALANGASRLGNPLESDDTFHMRAALGAFGAGFADDAGDIVVQGVGNHLTAPRAPLDCGLSGTTLRFLTAIAASAEGATTLTGNAPLLRRPMDPLVDALTALGAQITYLGEPGCAPLRVQGPLRGGYCRIDASKSSQFLTALLLAAPAARDAVEIEVVGLSSRPYIEMTLQAMARFGVTVHRDGDRFAIDSGQTYAARDYPVEYDASSAAHILSLAAATGGEITVTNATAETLQADARYTDYLATMGCDVVRAGEWLTVRGPARLEALERDLNDTPDMVSALAVLCAYARGESHIHNVEIVRGHETDRLNATATELRKLGVRVVESRDGLRLLGPVTGPGRLATYHDHRMAMSFAAAGARTAGITIEDPGCVAKTYPNFWEHLTTLGLTLR